MFNFFKKKDKNNQLSLHEKWELDAESYKNPNYKAKTGEGQCCNCIHKVIKTHRLNCDIFGDCDNINKDVLFNRKHCEHFKMTDQAQWKILNSISYDYNGYDIVFEPGKTELSIYNEISKIISNNKYILSELDYYKKLNINSSTEEFFEFYNIWIRDLQDKHFVAHLSNDTTIEKFANDIIEILKNYNINIETEEIISSYQAFLDNNKIDNNINHNILEANIVAKIIRKFNLELIDLFDGYSNEEFCIIPVSKIDEMEKLEKLIK